MRDCPYCEATKEADAERAVTLEKVKAKMTMVREAIDRADAEPFGKLSALLDRMAVDCDDALRLLKE